jgi:hypothetical protein
LQESLAYPCQPLDLPPVILGHYSTAAKVEQLHIALVLFQGLVAPEDRPPSLFLIVAMPVSKAVVSNTPPHEHFTAITTSICKVPAALPFHGAVAVACALTDWFGKPDSLLTIQRHVHHLAFVSLDGPAREHAQNLCLCPH